MNSILAPEFRGVITLSGRKGVGKSFLAIQADAPQNEVFFDFEEKGEGLDNQQPFGVYRSLYAEISGDGSMLYRHTQDAIANLEKDRYTVAIFDNISHLETAMRQEVQANPTRYSREFGLVADNIIKGRYGGASGAVNPMITKYICMPLYARGIKLIVVTSHLKPPWAGGGPVPNKFYALGAERWQELSILSLILVPGDYPPVPSAIVIKEQLGSIKWTGEDWAIARRLPTRIPKCTFAEIRRYLKEPANIDNPLPGERPSRAEADMYSAEFTPEQMAMVKMMISQKEREDKAQQELANNQAQIVNSRIKELVGQGKDLAEIWQQVNEEFETDYSLGQISAMMEE